MNEFLLVSFTPHPRFVSGEYVSDFAMIREEVLERLRAVSIDSLDAWGFNSPIEFQEDENIYYSDALDHIEDAFSHYMVNDHDEVIKFSIDGSRLHILAGGMSTGDDPSDAWRVLQPIAISEIFEEAFGGGDQLTV